MKVTMFIVGVQGTFKTTIARQIASMLEQNWYVEVRDLSQSYLDIYDPVGDPAAERQLQIYCGTPTTFESMSGELLDLVDSPVGDVDDA